MAQEKKQLKFDPNFIFSAIEDWKEEACKYEQISQQHYKRIRSYLTLFQFRLHDEQKCEIREKLAQSLDEINSNDCVNDLDSYLEGFCFKLDHTVLPSQPKQPKEVRIEIAQPEKPTHQNSSAYKDPPNFSAYEPPQNISDYTIDCNDLDYYTLQFFQ